MPSPGEDIQSWSTTAANNGSSDPLIVWSEGQARASVNNSSRSEMAAHAKSRNLLNGSIVTTGSANAQAFVSGVSYTSIPTGLVVKLKIGSGLTNTGSATLNMDGIGDTLIKTADGTNLLGRELIANAYTDLLYNGTNWIFLYSREFVMDRLDGGGIIIGKQIFSTPGTFLYTPTPLTECVIVECIGGGGGGGGAYAPVGWGQGAGGGGSGGYSRSVLTAASIGTSQTVTVGAGGAGGSASGPQPGSAGGFTSLGGLVTAYGGAGAQGAYGVTATNGGVGAGVGVGDIAVAGSAGECGLAISNALDVFVSGGSGGPGPFGGRGASTNANVAADGGSAPATGYGGGGAGGLGWYGQTHAGAGGNGAGGLCIVTEFAGRGAPGRDGSTGATGPAGPAGPAGAGTGDVLVSGTPAAGQIAEWVDTSHIRGIAPPTGFTTGDAKLTLKTTADSGWVMMNDGTIGNTASGASTRANADCQALFILLFNNISDTYAPLLTSTGAATTRAAQGNNATAAFTANCRMSLTKQLGRSLSIAGTGAGLTARGLGQTLGAETQTLTVAHMPAHAHPGSFTPNQYAIPAGTTNAAFGVDFTTYSALTLSQLVTVASQGNGSSFDIMQPATFWNVMIKL